MTARHPSSPHAPKSSRAFTLVELLVVIAIIALLMALLLPAVQSAREAARLVTCRNNARQLAQGAMTHLELQGYFPAGGWGWGWTGDADKGFGSTQVGGWAYSTLPYIEQKALHQLGAGMDDTAKRAANAQRMATPVSTFYCPSRRQPRALTSTSVHTPINGNRPAAYAKSDYAANGGDFRGGLPYSWVGGDPDEKADLARCTGVIGVHSEFRPDDVTDGLSLTLLVAEKYLNPDAYNTGTDGADNGDAWQGKDWDTVRWTWQSNNQAAPPTQDRPGVAVIERFGSAHASGITAAACDGSVRGVRFDIDANLWRRLGNRRDTAAGNNTPTDWPR
jgi:prepilin-type N-terminal cleavage/methylation domain-containing protein